jgi:hypothetical protein
MGRDDDLGTFAARMSLAAVMTALFPGRLVVVRCLCRDSIVTAWVSGGAARHVVLNSWN